MLFCFTQAVQQNNWTSAEADQQGNWHSLITILILTGILYEDRVLTGFVIQAQAGFCVRNAVCLALIQVLSSAFACRMDRTIACTDCQLQKTCWRGIFLSPLLVLVHRFLLFLSRYFLAMEDLDLCTKLKISTLRKPVNMVWQLVITSLRKTFILLIVLTQHPIPCTAYCVSSFKVTGVQKTDKFFTRFHATFWWDVIAQCCYLLCHLGTSA